MISAYEALGAAAPGWNPDTAPVEPSPQAKQALAVAMDRQARLMCGEQMLSPALMVAAVREVSDRGLAGFDGLLSWVVSTLMGARIVPMEEQ